MPYVEQVIKLLFEYSIPMVVIGVRGRERQQLISLSFLDIQTILTASNYSQYDPVTVNFVENQIWMIRFLVLSKYAVQKLT